MTNVKGGAIIIKQAVDTRYIRYPNKFPYLLLWLAVSIMATPAQSEECSDADTGKFICGINNAEDLIRVPDAPFVIASGRISAQAGPLYAVQTQTAAVTEIFPTNALPPRAHRQASHGCPGPTRQFQPHGISIRPGEHGEHTLYVVGHGEREAIEIFALNVTGEVPTLRWTDCLPAPAEVDRFNAITALPDGRVAVTNLPPRESANRGGGEVWEWSPTSGWQIVPGSAMHGPNGVVSSADGSWLYVAEYFNQRLVKISLGQEPPKIVPVDVGYSIDNIRWSQDRKLLLTAHDRNCKINGECEWVSATHVLMADPETLKVDWLFSYPTTPEFPVGTVVVDIDQELWMGGIINTQRVMRFASPLAERN